MYTRNEVVTIYENAQKYGGSFMKALTDALMKADAENQQKLENEFKKDFKRYL